MAHRLTAPPSRSALIIGPKRDSAPAPTSRPIRAIRSSSSMPSRSPASAKGPLAQGKSALQSADDPPVGIVKGHVFEVGLDHAAAPIVRP